MEESGTLVASSQRMLNIDPTLVSDTPFPHLTSTEMLPPSIFEQLKADYPTDEELDATVGTNGRAGRDVYRGEPAFEKLLARSAAWRDFFAYANSPEYVDLVLRCFGQYLEEYGCSVDPKKAHWTDHVEPREELGPKSRAARALSRLSSASKLDPNDLFVRFDPAQARAGYHKPVHCDISNRLTTMLIYFSDARPADGGVLRIHEHLEQKDLARYERHPKEEQTKVVAELVPRENSGALLLCCNNSYHSATPVMGDDTRRNYLYMSVSSRNPDIW